jgi:hypothetical protein
MTDQPQHPLQRMTNARYEQLSRLSPEIEARLNNSFEIELWRGLRAEREHVAVLTETDKPTPTTPLPCPFCGEPPVVSPDAEDVASGKEGGAYGLVECQNVECQAQPRVCDGEQISDSRGSEEYKRLAVVRWNRRYVCLT